MSESSESKGIFLEDVKRLVVQPGDIIVLTTDKLYTEREIDDIQQVIRSRLDDTVKVLFLTGGIKLEQVLSGDKEWNTPDDVSLSELHDWRNVKMEGV